MAPQWCYIEMEIEMDIQTILAEKKEFPKPDLKQACYSGGWMNRINARMKQMGVQKVMLVF